MTRRIVHPCEDSWYCLNCGVRGVSWAHSEKALTRRIWVHHGMKSPKCRYRRDDVKRRRVQSKAA